MAIGELKAKLAAVVTAVKTSVATAASERINKARAKAAEKAAKVEEAKELKYLIDAGYTPVIATGVAELQEIYGLYEQAETELSNARRTKDEAVTTAAQAVVDEVKSEKERLESDSDVAFFGWLRWLEIQTETNPDKKLALGEINQAVEDKLLREIDGETASRIQAEAKQAKADGRDAERSAPFFAVRVKPRGGVPQGQMEPADHFRYVSGGHEFYARNTEGARKRLVFFALQDLWKAVGEAKKAEWVAKQEIKAHSHLTPAEIAAGKTGQAWAEIKQDNPWRPQIFNKSYVDQGTGRTGRMEPLMRDGKEVINYGPVVIESVPNQNPKLGTIRILNIVSSGMYHPLRLAGAWNEDGSPRDFTFFIGNNPRTGQPNNFAGLKAAKEGVDVLMSPGRYGRLRAILCLAGGLQQATEKTEGAEPEAGVDKDLNEEYLAPEKSTIQRDSQPQTERGSRADGTAAGEPRRQVRGKSRKSARPQAEEPVPDLSRVSTLADGRAAVGDEPVGTETVAAAESVTE